MGHQTPGPLCSSRVGDTWIDSGTSCRTQTSPPGIGTAVKIVADSMTNPDKLAFDRDHGYSLAPEAARKRDIDLQIIGDDYKRSREISITNEKYLKELIRLGSHGKQVVSDRAKKIQFFIVRGGAEGFHGEALSKVNAGDFTSGGQTTDGKKSRTFRWDLNDLLIVFDPKGKLIRAAFLQRPISISGKWRAETSTAIYNTWHDKGVSIYRNTNFGVPYLGLVVSDGMKDKGWVDMHKQEATNGCIFIVDNTTPEYGKPELDAFEPKLIHEVLASIGKKAEDVKGMISLGVIKTVTIK